ncbi:MAG: type II toxin-antitoxin system VapC family toxin [Chloroflexi bacterium]|nr:type II toxin-antitoxin system VapC family toxin [Chloroflexota bacterium]
MRVLLDTHVLLWLLAGSERVSDRTRSLLADPSNDVFTSVASAWEIAIKVGLGKLNVPPALVTWLPQQLAASRLAVLPITIEHALGVERLPTHHADPFDRLLVAQAMAEDLVLATGDRYLERYDVRVMRP